MLAYWPSVWSRHDGQGLERRSFLRIDSGHALMGQGLLGGISNVSRVLFWYRFGRRCHFSRAASHFGTFLVINPYETMAFGPSDGQDTADQSERVGGEGGE